MAKLQLIDGRMVDVVQPTVQQKILAQTQIRKAFRIGPKEMVDVVQSIEYLTMLPVFATLHGARVPVSMPELMEDEQLAKWSALISPDSEDLEMEGEQSVDPQIPEIPGQSGQEDQPSSDWI